MVRLNSIRRNSLRQLIIWIALAAVIVATDQISKTVILQSLYVGEARAYTSFFSLVLTFNKGAAFSFLANASGWQDEFFTIIGLGAALFIVWLLSQHGSQFLFSLGLTLILGGAIGNVTDRIMYGHVIDFLLLHYKGWSWPAFNLADSAIVGGALLLISDEMRRVRRAK